MPCDGCGHHCLEGSVGPPPAQYARSKPASAGERCCSQNCRLTDHVGLVDGEGSSPALEAQQLSATTGSCTNAGHKTAELLTVHACFRQSVQAQHARQPHRQGVALQGRPRRRSVGRRSQRRSQPPQQRLAADLKSRSFELDVVTGAAGPCALQCLRYTASLSAAPEW